MYKPVSEDIVQKIYGISQDNDIGTLYYFTYLCVLVYEQKNHEVLSMHMRRMDI